MKRISKRNRRKNQKIKRVAVLILAGGIMAIVLLGVVFAVSNFVQQRFFPQEEGIHYDKINAKQPEIDQQFLTPNVNSRPQIELTEIKGVVIHYTANPGTDAQANRDYFEGRKDEPDEGQNKVSSHYIIGLEGNIIQCIPLNEIAYASNDRNKDTISIECCHPRKNGKFNNKTYQSLVQLCVWLCDKYELTKGSIIRHYDVTGKICPKYYVKHQAAWERLKDTIWNRLKEEEED